MDVGVAIVGKHGLQGSESIRHYGNIKRRVPSTEYHLQISVIDNFFPNRIHRSPIR